MPAPLPCPAADARDLLGQAMQAHGAGQLDQAQALYRQLLAAEARHPDALHLLGVLLAQRGEHEPAAALIQQAIEARPGEAMFHNNLGNVCIETRQFDAAEQHYLHALELDGQRIDALNNLGVLLSRRGQPEQAERVLLRVVELAPDFADARQNLANHYLRQGRIGEAVQHCCDGLIVAPRSQALRRLLGLAYTTMGRVEDAAAVYRAWLDAEPDNAVARHHWLACTGGQVPERAPDRYVTQVFDSFAQSFDAKLAELSYQAPALVAQRVAELLGPAQRRLAVLDAGCGTGLCGPLLAPYARSLHGVDLSAGMLRKALARKVYDELLQGELVALLASRPAAFDLIVSADTLCYFGALRAFAAAALAALRPGGLLVFTAEAHADEAGAPDYLLHGHGRYSHRLGYLEGVLGQAGFGLRQTRSVVLRMEAGQPVAGWLVAAGVDADPQH